MVERKAILSNDTFLKFHVGLRPFLQRPLGNLIFFATGSWEYHCVPLMFACIFIKKWNCIPIYVCIFFQTEGSGGVFRFCSKISVDKYFFDLSLSYFYFGRQRHWILWKKKKIKVQRVDLMCDVIRKIAPFVLSKLWRLVADWSMRWSCDTFLIKLRLYINWSVNTKKTFSLTDPKSKSYAETLD